MGFLEKILGKKEEKTRSYGVCIPLHKKEKTAKEEEKPVEAKPDSTEFQVDGYYQSKTQAMVRGTVKKGTITTKNKALIGGKEFKIAEIRINQDKVKILKEGDYGAIFLRGKGIPLHGGKIIEIK
ncbi:MAG: hypothetical protein QXK06_03415 [Candidatus Diapherotrites archaeon]